MSVFPFTLRAQVVLTRVGDFYESFGYDAVLLVEFCGLNRMGDMLRAGSRRALALTVTIQ